MPSTPPPADRQTVTLISAPRRRALTPALAARVAGALASYGARVGPPDWLAPGVACDLAVSGVPSQAIRNILGEALGDAPIDRVVQGAARRAKRLLVADMDSTIVTGESLDELAALAGVGDAVARITARAMAGEIDFEAALRARVAMLAGRPAALLDAAAAALQPAPGAAALVATMRAKGARAVLVSGGFEWFVAPIAARLGFDDYVCNALVIEGGHISGAVREPIVGRETKRAVLHREAQRLKLGLRQSLAVGDGANDLAMLADAGLGVAYHAKPAVAAVVAEMGGARIEYGDLRALLYLQGYRARDVVTG